MNSDKAIDQPSEEDTIAALVGVQMLMAATGVLEDSGIEKEQYPTIISNAIVGVFMLGGRSGYGGMIEVLKKAIDEAPAKNWTRFGTLSDRRGEF
jgi:hypothetical protein